MRKAYQQILKDSFLSRYREKRDVWTGEEAMDACTTYFFAKLHCTNNLRALDIGAGRGRDTQRLLQMGYHTTALDLVKTENWKDIEAQHQSHLQFEVSDFLEWIPPTSNYDLIIDNGCFHHQDPSHYAIYLKKIREILNKQGTYCLSVFTPEDESILTGKTSVIDSGRLGKYFSVSELDKTLKEQGLKLIEWKKVYRPLFDSYYLAAIIQSGSQC